MRARWRPSMVRLPPSSKAPMAVRRLRADATAGAGGGVSRRERASGTLVLGGKLARRVRQSCCKGTLRTSGAWYACNKQRREIRLHSKFLLLRISRLPGRPIWKCAISNADGQGKGITLRCC